MEIIVGSVLLACLVGILIFAGYQDYQNLKSHKLTRKVYREEIVKIRKCLEKIMEDN